MNPKQLLLKFLSGATFAAAMLFSSSALFAQVKIGTAPATIDVNNNLEVQGSTTGRKLSVDKTSGKMTYAEGTQGIDKVLTSDADGVATWQKVGTQNISQLPKGKLNGGTSGLFANGSSSTSQVTYGSLDFAENGVTKVGNGLRVPVSGYYLIINNTLIQHSGCDGVTSLFTISTNLYINGSAAGTIPANDKYTYRRNEFNNSLNTALLHLNANDVITLQRTTSIGVEAGCTSKIADGELTVSYQP